MSWYLQSSYGVTDNATIRVTDDPTGVPTTSDFAITEGTVYDSHDDFCTAWNAQLVADFGAGYAVALSDDSDYRGKTIVTTTGNNFSIDWSQSGDGSNVRNWLGETGNVTDQATGYQFTSKARATFYGDRGAQSIKRTSTSRPGAGVTSLSGAGRSQHSTSLSDTDTVWIDAVLWFGDSSNAYSGHARFELWLDDLFDYDGVLARFSIYHGGEQWVCRFADEVVDIQTRKVPGSAKADLYEISLSLIGEVTPW